MVKMLDRLFKSGFITTILGATIIVASIIMFYTHEAKFTEIIGWLGLALAFLRSKDTLIGKKDNTEV
jgi:hypothetical protein